MKNCLDDGEYLKAKNRGKRGGLRIIYYWRNTAEEIWMLTVYAKNEEENLPPEVLQKLREELERL